MSSQENPRPQSGPQSGPIAKSLSSTFHKGKDGITAYALPMNPLRVNESDTNSPIGSPHVEEYQHPSGKGRPSSAHK